MKRWLAFEIVCVYAASVIFSFGAINADLQTRPWYDRHVAGVALAFALLPIGNVMTAVLGTGFCENGFSYSIPPRGEAKK